MTVSRLLPRGAAAGGLALVLIAGLAALDVWHPDRALLAEGRPTFGLAELLRSGLVFLASLLGVRALELEGPPPSERGGFGRLVAAATLIAACALLLLFLLNPTLYSSLAAEDGPIENASALLLFASGLVMGRAAFSMSARSGHRLAAWAALGLAAVFLLIGLEEVSWFQRTLEIETPEAFKGNLQREVNLHNFATNQTENAYYFGAFVFLILLPLAGYRQGLADRFGLEPLVPDTLVPLVAGVAFAHNYDMWPGLPTQLAFYTTLVVLYLYARAWRDSGADPFLPVAAISACVVAQGVFLIFGERFGRLWDVTEYKELWIPLAFTVYSVGVLRRVRTRPDGPRAAPSR